VCGGAAGGLNPTNVTFKDSTAVNHGREFCDPTGTGTVWLRTGGSRLGLQTSAARLLHCRPRSMATLPASTNPCSSFTLALVAPTPRGIALPSMGGRSKIWRVKSIHSCIRTDHGMGGAFSNRNVHLRMPLGSTPAHFKLLHA
jgi:hypothetical protein